MDDETESDVDRGLLELLGLLDDESLARFLDEDDEEGHAEVIVSTAKHQARRRLASWRSNAARDADAMEARQARFEHRIADWPWGHAFRELDMLWNLSIRVAKGYVARQGPAADRQQDHRFSACTLLHRRALRVTAEIRTLLRAGFASGALARWRTLHEITVVVSFLQQEADEVAVRYLEHEAIMRARTRQEIHRAGPSFADELPSPDELAELTRLEARLLAQYGPGFAAQYGWARKALHLSRDPELRDLERATRLSHWRPYVDLAHGPMHAGARALIFDIGTPDDDLGTVIGSSNLGMSDPGQCAALSLVACTAAWLAIRPDFRALVDMVALSDWGAAVVDAFVEAHQAQLELFQETQDP